MKNSILNRYRNKLIGIFALSGFLLFGPLMAESANAWRLYVELTDKPFGDDKAYVKVKGPDGWEQYKWYNWASIKTGPSTGEVVWSLSESNFPSGEPYEVCVSSKAGFSLIPYCYYFTHGTGDEKVSVPLS